MARASTGERVRRRLDPRLAIGLVLVVGSTAGVWVLVTGLDSGSEVYAVRATVTPGHRLDASDLVRRSVRLGGTLERYVTPGSVPGEGVVVTRTIQEGELVPWSAVAPEDAADVATVVVTTRGALPKGLGPGSLVDVWSAPATEGGDHGAPAVLIAGAEIAAVVTADGLLASDHAAVELSVTHDQVGPVLTALAAGDELDLIAARLEEAERPPAAPPEAVG
ncbi:hypothetical protein [Agromyces aerolatus]|uniref:hypothetical protein n=1 Tax=Agromyces sp. LY-1074 TaxID=3074080 RepID=UPI0028545D32|nr:MULTISPECIES: hypothetical protein [unclassified Agromyces]MDR5699830.1 hypothetical protein [Agromyces sp. LY-1074]MDR5706358.1 hypothetical protein [Agromyces sp. LY-1358]